MSKIVPGPIGVFDSGIGGLTIMHDLIEALPEYDYIYLGDNARAPYGNRSLQTVYQYTLQGVGELFTRGCHLVILACNTASANALRTIQQKDLAQWGPHKRVLGVIRPTTERLAELSNTGHLGIMATEATVHSGSYVIEAQKYAEKVSVFQQACPMWVPLIENQEQESEAAVLFTKKYVNALLSQSAEIDTILLACTHYPIIYDLIRAQVPSGVKILTQGSLVAESFVDYLKRHEWMRAQCSNGGSYQFLTTDDAANFDAHASQFFGESVVSEKIELGSHASPAKRQ